MPDVSAQPEPTRRSLLARHPLVGFFVMAYAFTWIPYIRNLIIHRRHEDAHLNCPECAEVCPPHSKYCLSCGARLAPTSESVVRS